MLFEPNYVPVLDSQVCGGYIESCSDRCMYGLSRVQITIGYNLDTL
jgi:hypothetical protein